MINPSSQEDIGRQVVYIGKTSGRHQHGDRGIVNAFSSDLSARCVWVSFGPEACYPIACQDLEWHVELPPKTALTGQDRWDNHFLGLALYHAGMSKDPSTKVGSVIVGPDREVRSLGFNGFPRGIADTAERLNDRDTKLKIVVHAEMNAILAAARIGVSVKGCTLYLCATDSSGLIWGGAPCSRCTVEIIQAGIGAIVTRPFKTVPSRWAGDVEAARLLLHEANIDYREVSLP